MVLDRDPFFESLIRKMAKTRSTNTMGFHGYTRAVTVTSEMICSAKNKVNIFWKTMYDPVLNNEFFIASIKDALGRGVGFTVMEQQVDPVPSELENIFRSSNAAFKQIRAPNEWDYNVISSDNIAYVFWSRFSDKGEFCFNNPTKACGYNIE